MPGISGIGAGADSYFEYAMKAAILLGEYIPRSLPIIKLKRDLQATIHTSTFFVMPTPPSRLMSEHPTASL